MSSGVDRDVVRVAAVVDDDNHQNRRRRQLSPEEILNFPGEIRSTAERISAMSRNGLLAPPSSHRPSGGGGGGGASSSLPSATSMAVAAIAGRQRQQQQLRRRRHRPRTFQGDDGDEEESSGDDEEGIPLAIHTPDVPSTATAATATTRHTPPPNPSLTQPRQQRSRSSSPPVDRPVEEFDGMDRLRGGNDDTSLFSRDTSVIVHPSRTVDDLNDDGGRGGGGGGGSEEEQELTHARPPSVSAIAAPATSTAAAEETATAERQSDDSGNREGQGDDGGSAPNDLRPGPARTSSLDPYRRAVAFRDRMRAESARRRRRLGLNDDGVEARAAREREAFRRAEENDRRREQPRQEDGGGDDDDSRGSMPGLVERSGISSSEDDDSDYDEEDDEELPDLIDWRPANDGPGVGNDNDGEAAPQRATADRTMEDRAVRSLQSFSTMAMPPLGLLGALAGARPPRLAVPGLAPDGGGGGEGADDPLLRALFMRDENSAMAEVEEILFRLALERSAFEASSGYDSRRRDELVCPTCQKVHLPLDANDDARAAEAEGNRSGTDEAVRRRVAGRGPPMRSEGLDPDDSDNNENIPDLTDYRSGSDADVPDLEQAATAPAPAVRRYSDHSSDADIPDLVPEPVDDDHNGSSGGRNRDTEAEWEEEPEIIMIDGDDFEPDEAAVHRARRWVEEGGWWRRLPAGEDAEVSESPAAAPAPPSIPNEGEAGDGGESGGTADAEEDVADPLDGGGGNEGGRRGQRPPGRRGDEDVAPATSTLPSVIPSSSIDVAAALEEVGRPFTSSEGEEKEEEEMEEEDQPDRPIGDTNTPAEEWRSYGDSEEEVKEEEKEDESSVGTSPSLPGLIDQSSSDGDTSSIETAPFLDGLSGEADPPSVTTVAPAVGDGEDRVIITMPPATDDSGDDEGGDEVVAATAAAVNAGFSGSVVGPPASSEVRGGRPRRNVFDPDEEEEAKEEERNENSARAGSAVSPSDSESTDSMPPLIDPSAWDGSSSSEDDDNDDDGTNIADGNERGNVRGPPNAGGSLLGSIRRDWERLHPTFFGRAEGRTPRPVWTSFHPAPMLARDRPRSLTPPPARESSSSPTNPVTRQRDYGGLLVYVTAKCPVCLEDVSPVIALKCGHVLCRDDYHRMGGKLEGYEPQEQEREERAAERAQADRAAAASRRAREEALLAARRRRQSEASRRPRNMPRRREGGVDAGEVNDDDDDSLMNSSDDDSESSSGSLSMPPLVSRSSSSSDDDGMIVLPAAVRAQHRPGRAGSTVVELVDNEVASAASSAPQGSRRLVDGEGDDVREDDESMPPLVDLGGRVITTDGEDAGDNTSSLA